MNNTIEQFRKNFSTENIGAAQSDSGVMESISPNEKYKLTYQYFRSEAVGEFYNVKVFDNISNEKLFDFNGADRVFNFAWLTKNEEDYLLGAEYMYGGQSIINLTKREMNGFKQKDDDYVIQQYFLNTKENLLATAGSMQGGSQMIKVFYFEHPTILPWPEYYFEVTECQDEQIIKWIDDYTLLTEGTEIIDEKIDEGNGAFSRKEISRKPYSKERFVIQNVTYEFQTETSVRDVMYFTKEDKLLYIEAVVQMPIKDIVHKNWVCAYFLLGIEVIHKDIFGESAIQAMNLAMQLIKLHLMMMIDDGYLICEMDNNDLAVNIQTKRNSIRNINAIYGLTTLNDKTHTNEHCLQAIERLQEGIGTDKEQNADLDFLRDNMADPEISDYIFHSKIEMTAEEILGKALSYKPIIL